jgi:hypothetical protein
LAPVQCTGVSLAASKLPQFQGRWGDHLLQRPRSERWPLSAPCRFLQRLQETSPGKKRPNLDTSDPTGLFRCGAGVQKPVESITRSPGRQDAPPCASFAHRFDAGQPHEHELRPAHPHGWTCERGATRRGPEGCSGSGRHALDVVDLIRRGSTPLPGVGSEVPALVLVPGKDAPADLLPILGELRAPVTSLPSWSAWSGLLDVLRLLGRPLSG